MEATSHGSALHRLDRVRFSVLVFTNLDQDHLDFHDGMEGYFDAKRRLFVGDDAPPAAVNVGDHYGRRLAAELRDRGTPLLTYGLSDDAEIRPGTVDVDSPLRGRFNLENVLGTIAAGRLLGVDDQAIARGIGSVSGVPGRFQLVDEGQLFAVIVDYAHKPAALENDLRTARDLGSGRLICVFGCGGDRDRGKRPLMGRIASDLADVVIVTSDNPRSEDPLAIIDEIVAGMSSEPEIEPDRARAIGRAIELAGADDVVVIAGKGHERGQETAGVITPFDDVEVAGELLRALKTTA
jgi:UDP-N-acetylmuramoyl-L-alanyl-D-glutamate--2,6-diaminopimelate ligase